MCVFYLWSLFQTVFKRFVFVFAMVVIARLN